MINPPFIDLKILMRHPFLEEDDRILPVNIGVEATIGDLKMEIERLTKIPPKCQLLWCQKDSMEPLEDDLTIWDSERGGFSERIGMEIVFQNASSKFTLQVHTAGFKLPLLVDAYYVDTISEIKQLVRKEIKWWKLLAELEELDLSLALYSFSGQKFTDEFLIGDNYNYDDEAGLDEKLKCVVSIRMKAMAVTESTESIKTYKIFMFDDLLQFYINAADSCPIDDLKRKMMEVLEIMDLVGDKNLHVIDQEPNMYAELV